MYIISFSWMLIATPQVTQIGLSTNKIHFALTSLSTKYRWWWRKSVALTLCHYDTDVQVAQLLKRHCAAGWVSNGQKWKTETIFTDNIGLYSTTVTYFASKEIEIGQKTQNKGCYAVYGPSKSSKVIEVGTNWKPVCDFLLVINSNYHPISYRFRDIAAYCSNFRHFAFLSHPLGA